MKDPKAIEPKWYLITHQYPLVNEPDPFESEVELKYHIEHAADITNCVQPIKNAFIHKYPNSEYQNTYVVF
jgi:hypothetical protein